MSAVKCGELLHLKTFLVDNPEDINKEYENGTLLHVACQGNYLEVVSMLLDFQLDIEAKDKDGKVKHYFLASF